MFTIINTFVGSILLSTSALINPVAPKALPFDASAYVTVNHEIRVSVNKESYVAVDILLRDKRNGILFQQSISKKEANYAVKLNVKELADGEYDLEIKSNGGSIHKQITLATEPEKQASRVVAMQVSFTKN